MKWLRKQVLDYGSEGETSSGEIKDVRASNWEWTETSLLLPHHPEMFWDERGETFMKGGPQLMIPWLPHCHWQRCDSQKSPAGCKYLCLNLNLGS